jgi:hypothetical protein
MKNFNLLFALLLFISAVSAQQPDFNYSDNIQAVKLNRPGDPYSMPMLRLNSTEQLELNFDDLDGDIKNYYYTFQLCNADWTPSNLQPFDYIKGFQSNRLNTYRNSSIALTRYTHYELVFPERNMSPTRSGNYLLKIFLNNDTSQLVLTRRFMVLDNRISVAAQVRTPFDSRYTLTDQRIQVALNTANARINLLSPQDVKLVVMQNNSWFNSVLVNRPTVYRGNYLEYNDDQLCFQAGREWRWIDIRSMQLMSERMDSMRPIDGRMNVFVKPDRDRRQLVYTFYQDLNGQFVFENRDRFNPLWQSDFALTHFTFIPPGNQAISGRDVYLYGELTQYRPDDHSRMEFNAEKGVYEKTLLLKQGFYNYNYITLDGRADRNDRLSYLNTEGNFQATENKYTVLVYFRPFGARADELLGIAEVNSRLN